MKKFVAIVLVLAMVLSLATVAFAEKKQINPVDVIGTYWVVKALVAQVKDVVSNPVMMDFLKVAVPVGAVAVVGATVVNFALRVMFGGMKNALEDDGKISVIIEGPTAGILE